MSNLNQTAINMTIDGVTSDVEYWSNVFNGKEPPSATNMKSICDRYHLALADKFGTLPSPTVPAGSKYYVDNGIHFVEIPINNFKIQYWDKPKKNSSPSSCFNLGYFGVFSDGGTTFTLPVANLVADINEKDVSPVALKYLKEREVKNGKLRFYCSQNSGAQFKNKAVSTLVLDDKGAHIAQYNKLPSNVKYAVSGAPIVVDGKDPSWSSYVSKEGWDSSIARATWHGFLALKENSKIYYIAMQTTSSNCFISSEVYNRLNKYGFADIIKIDSGGSFIFNYNGKMIASTSENRKVNNIGVF